MNVSRWWTIALLVALGGCRQIAGIDDLSEQDERRRLEEAPCNSNAQCIERFGDNHLCRRADRRCVPLLSPECQVVAGDALDDHAVILGSVEPASGLNGATGRSMRLALGLAIEDFAVGSKGLPPLPGTTERRPLAILHCDDQGQSTLAVKAATHLAEVVRVPAIVGAAFSGVTLDVATQVTLSTSTLLMSPSATSASITNLQDSDLLWRTAPSDVVQAAAQAALIERVERELRGLRSDSDAPLKLTVLHKGDAYGVGLADGVLKALTWNRRNATAGDNRPFVARHDYGDPSNPQVNPPRYEDAVTRTVAAQPDVILVYGTSEAAEGVVKPIEERWPENAVRPRYVLADGGRSDELRAAIMQLDPEGRNRLAMRILGTEPGSLSVVQGTFRVRYSDRTDNPEEPIAFGAANAYDAVYLLAYGVVRSNLAAPTGRDVAAALQQLLPSPGEASEELHVGADAVTTAFRFLSERRRLTLNGASGPLRFDLATGDVLSDILLWCPQANASGVTLAPYGEIYQTSTQMLVVVDEVSASTCGYKP